MKKLNLLLVILVFFLTQSAFSQNNWVSFSGSDPQFPVVEVEDQDMNGLTLNITVPGMFSENVVHDGITYQRLTFEAWQTLHEVGMPELPIIIVSWLYLWRIGPWENIAPRLTLAGVPCDP